jgi:hypothetical protein
MQRRFYRIRVAGTLGERFLDSFGFMRMEPARGGTVLSGVCVDASALFGVLDQIRDLGLELLEVESFAVVPSAGITPADRPGTPQ